MIDHLGIAVSDIARSRCFYDAALGALGMAVHMEVGPDQTESGGTALAVTIGGGEGVVAAVPGDVDEPDQHAGVSFPALHVHGIGNDTPAVGQMAAVPALEGAGDFAVYAGQIQRQPH